jgi:very-short-patch-repair endonuclease
LDLFKVPLFIRKGFRESSSLNTKIIFMSLKHKKELVKVAKEVCRGLRKRSTKAEIILWEFLRRKNLSGKKFYRQYPFFHDMTGKETFFIADFYCHEEKLIIELDGKYHQYRLQGDEKRTHILNSLGVRVIRFKNDEVENNPECVVSKIKKHLECNQ